MNSTLEYIASKFELDLNQKSPINILKINREIMAQTLKELNFNFGAEIGVARGEHSELLCLANPDLKLYCIDIWEPYEGYKEYENKISAYYKLAKKRLSKYNTVMIKKFSMDAVKTFENESLDFVYIDGAHDFQNGVNDICEWTKKVKIGGIVYGHDYDRQYERHLVQIKDAVQAYCYTNRIKPWFVLGMPGKKRDGLYVEGVQSWMFVRQESDIVV